MRFQEIGLKNYVARKVPLISKQNKVRLLNFAKKYIWVTPEFWEKIIWNDESKFEITDNKKRQEVWQSVIYWATS